MCANTPEQLQICTTPKKEQEITEILWNTQSIIEKQRLNLCKAIARATDTEVAA
jgi:hypothetical protein